MKSASIPSEFLLQHMAILGKTGSGKSYAAKVLVERLLADSRRVCVIDPTGVWWGLRSSADGKRPGFQVAIFGGEHGDIEIAPTSGRPIAELLASRNLPAVIDLSNMLIGDRHRFMTDFAEALHQHNRAPLNLVIDEADEFAPQNPLPETKRMLHQIDRIVRRGRVRGFRVMMITQRPAVLHKNVLTQANALIAMRLTAPQDRKALEEWIKGQADIEQGKAVMSSLASLQRGEGWVWAPEQSMLERVAFPRIITFDSGRTPEDGETITEPTRLADVDLSQIKQSLASAIEQAKADDPRELRKRITELERQLKHSVAAAPPAQPKTIEVERFIFREGEVKQLVDAVDRLAGLGEWFTGAAQGLREALRVAQQQPAPPMPRAQPVTQPRPQLAAPRATATNSAISGGLRRMMIALAQRPGLSAKQLGVRAGLSSSSGTFGTYLARLRSNGWVSGERDRLELTDIGLSELGNYEPLPEGRELLAHWLGELGNSGAARMLQALADAYPHGLTKAELGQVAGISHGSGTFGTYLAKLRTLELINGRDQLRANEELM